MGSMFSFDIVSSFDKAEMNNAYDQACRELTSRYDFKNTPAQLDWLDASKNGVRITGNSDVQIDAIMDILRKKLAARGINQKVLDVSKPAATTNFKTVKDVPFQQGLSAEKAKQVASLLRSDFPKLKYSIQGQEIRVSSPKKDELQAVIQHLQAADLDFPLSFTNFR